MSGDPFIWRAGGWSVNARCLHDVDSLTLNVAEFDGRNWERNGASLAHLSLEPS